MRNYPHTYADGSFRFEKARARARAGAGVEAAAKVRLQKGFGSLGDSEKEPRSLARAIMPRVSGRACVHVYNTRESNALSARPRTYAQEKLGSDARESERLTRPLFRR